ncbi:MAG: DUF433 domain-containing protein [Chloroflexota bacterium]|nr:DUF433 domain-containing protein [Chloroflexota bacterium]
MIHTPPTTTIPLRTDEEGTIRIGDTRITLETIIARFEQGDTPEQIHQGFPILERAQIYAVIGYYLDHQDEVTAYIQQQESAANEMRTDLEGQHSEIYDLEPKLRARITHKQDR